MGQFSSPQVTSIDIQDEPRFTGREKFICLSPIAVSTVIINDRGKKTPHFLDYTNPSEKPHFIQNLKKNLINKYETIHNIPYPTQDMPFNFHFDEEYIARKHGKISKLMEFKNQIKIKAMEAPFFIEADSELIKTGYECGWGEKNSAGFGCVDVLQQ